MKKLNILLTGLALSASISLQAQLTNQTSRVVEGGSYFETIEIVESHTNRTAGTVARTNRITTLKAGMFRKVNDE